MFNFKNFHTKKILKSSLVDNAFFTTRDFVLHPGKRNDLNDICRENLNFLKEKLNVKHIFRAKQVHSDNVEVAGNGKEIYEDCDGIIITEPSSACFLNFADCIPVILYDEVLDIGGVIHAGWRGTAKKICEKAVKKLNFLGSKSENIKALIGPGIGKCCFEVGEDTANELSKTVDNFNDFITSAKSKGKFFIDLKNINAQTLKNSGINRIDISDNCTVCENNVFFSYRKDHLCARHSAILTLKRKK